MAIKVITTFPINLLHREYIHDSSSSQNGFRRGVLVVFDNTIENIWTATQVGDRDGE